MRAEKHTSGQDMLPDGAARCVWMTAGLVAYKLCDRNFNCDECPLDAALQGDARAQGPCAHVGAHRHTAWNFPTDRRYARNHVWAKLAGTQRLRLGLDAFAAELVSTLSSVELPRPGGFLQPGEPVCQLSAAGVKFAVAVPLGGETARVNTRLEGQPNLVVHAPYDEGWLVELEVDVAESTDELDELVGAAEIQTHARHDLKRFRRHVAVELLNAANAVGPTQQDGGEPITDLREILGLERYVRLVAAILS